VSTANSDKSATKIERHPSVIQKSSSSSTSGRRLQRTELLSSASGSGSDIDAAIEIARRLLVRARELQTPQERRQQAELDRMISLPEDKATLVEMTDQAFRTSIAERVADQLTHILDVQGIPRFFSGLDRTMLRGFQSFGGFLPGVAVPLVKDKMRRETANVILPAEAETLSHHLRERHREGVRMNVNFLGEALIGEKEARRRLNAYLSALQNPSVECISVKISTIYSQNSPIGRKHTLHILADRLELLYRAAAREIFIRPDGTKTSKFVYLDMEEYRDMYLTRDALKATLGRAGLEQVRAGIALQAYVPDSFQVLSDLADWSKQRVDLAQRRGVTCQPLTVRIVKGANMEMERVEASVGGWPQAPYTSKIETDANFKRMVRESLKPEYADCLSIGIASHNLFDVALSLLWSARAGALDNRRVQFEMLEGMANHQRRAIFEVTDELLLYAPACRREDFIHAIGYLIRRLDENTGADNFLRHTFNLDPNGEAF
jgi:RHH-type proline utilization regulon transcriptional repressor/proline dehydrogenase/delta 1-pyrroline-5-carboxylate dehydrogenase